MALAETLTAALPGVAGIIIAAGGVLAQVRKGSPEQMVNLLARITEAEERSAKLEARAKAAEDRATELAGKVETLQDHLLDQAALLYNAQAKLVANGLMTREEQENPPSTNPVVGA